MENDINFDLPLIDLNIIKAQYEITHDDEDIIMGIIYNPVNGKGILRATRPKQSGIHSWVWRNVMMMVSPEEKFHNTATTLEGYLAGYDVPSLEQKLSILVDKIINTIPTEQLHGKKSWEASLGAI